MLSTLWPVYFKDFFVCVEYEGFARQTLQLISGCDVQYEISHTCF